MRVRSIALSMALAFMPLAASMVSPVPAIAISEEEKVSRAFKFARGLFDMEKYPEAASELQKFLSFHGKSKYAEYALYLLGESQYKAGEYSKALESYGRFKEKYPGSKLAEDVEYSLAYAAEAMGSPDLALGHYAKLLASARAEIRVDSLFRTARLLVSAKKFAEASDAFDRYFEAAGGAASKPGAEEAERFREALYISGNAGLKLRRTDLARSRYERLIELFPEELPAIPAGYNLGEMDYAAGELKKAAARYKAALGKLEGALKTGSEEARSYAGYIPKLQYSLGWCSYSAGDFVQAAERFAAAASDASFDNAPEALLRLGVCQYNQKKYNDASATFEKLRKTSKGGAKLLQEAEYYLALSMHRTGLSSNAIEHFEKAAAGTSEVAAEAAYMAAVMLFDSKRYQEAIDRFTDFARRFPRSSRAQNAAFNVALANLNMSRHREAGDAFNAFLRDYPSSQFASRAWFNLGEVALAQKDREGAIAWFQKIPSGDPLWLEAELKICEILRALGQNEKLEAKYRDILQKSDLSKADPDAVVPALFKIGKSLAARGDHELAIAAYEKVVTLSRSERVVSDARLRMAQAHHARGDFQKSLAEAEKLLAAGGGSQSLSEIRLLAAKNLAGVKKTEEAAGSFDRIVSDPEAPEHIRLEARYGKAVLLLDAKKHAEALEAFEALASDARDNEMLAGIHYGAAKCQDALGKTDEAIKNLLKVEILYKDTLRVDDARIALLELYVRTKQRKDAKALREEIMRSKAPKAIKDRAKELMK